MVIVQASNTGTAASGHQRHDSECTCTCRVIHQLLLIALGHVLHLGRMRMAFVSICWSLLDLAYWVWHNAMLQMHTLPRHACQF